MTEHLHAGSTYHIEIHQAQGLVIGDSAQVTQWIGDAEAQRRRVETGVTAERAALEEAKLVRAAGTGTRFLGVRPDAGKYFLDRDREREQIGALLADPTTRFISIVGQGGMGKTALACKVLDDLAQKRSAADLDGRPVDGIVYMSTRTAGISIERVFQDCARMLGGEAEKRLLSVWTNPELRTQAKVAQLLETLSGGMYVVLLDNLDDLLDTEGRLTDEGLQYFLEQSMRSGQGAALLATTRRELGLAFDVQALDEQLRLDEGLPVEEGVALLRRLDRKGRFRSLPDDELAQAVVTVHGVPRALQLIPSLLAGQPARTTLHEVMRRFYGSPEVVKALIDENYRRLTIDARQVMDALAVLRRPVSMVAVDYLLEPFAPGLDVPALVTELVAWSIVSEDYRSGLVSVHPADQDYAYNQLPDGEYGATGYTRQALERRAAAYYRELRTLEETWKTIDDLSPQMAEFDHLVKAGEYDAAWVLLKPLECRYLFPWGHYVRLQAMRTELSEGLASADSQADNLASLGGTSRALGKPAQAVEFYNQAIEIVRRLGDREREGFWLSDLGSAYRDLGQVGRAIAQYEHALALAHSIPSQALEGMQLGRLAFAYFTMGQIDQAINLQQEALKIAREVDNQRGEAGGLGLLGNAYLAKGDLEAALVLLNESLTISRKNKHRREESIRLGQLGAANFRKGKLDQASALYAEALAIALEIGDRRRQAQHLIGLAQTALAQGSLADARSRSDQALALAVPQVTYRAAVLKGILDLWEYPLASTKDFVAASLACESVLAEAETLWDPSYLLALARVGIAVSGPKWNDPQTRPESLAPASSQYQQALKVCSEPGVVEGAIQDLGFIRAAGIQGLEPLFELLSEHVSGKQDAQHGT